MRTYHLLTSLALALLSTSTLAAITPESLRCEYRTDPLGLDITSPRLSWIVTSPERAQSQSAYHILVASEPELLATNRADLWDSGKVASDDTTAITYAGKPLSSHQYAYWKVKVWDQNDKPSDWSPLARWSMGPLTQPEWKGHWIGFDEPRQELEFPDADFTGASWIWHPADPKGNAPKAPRLFVLDFEIPDNSQVEKAELLVAADDSYKFTVNGQLVADSGSDGFNKPRLVSLPTRIKPGKNSIRVEAANGSPGPAGLLAKLTVVADGKTHTLVTDASWKALDNPGANWHNRDLDTSTWPAAAVVGSYGDDPWGKLKLANLVLPPPVYLRSTFLPEKPVRRATLYATALGNVDLEINGKPVSSEYFTPGWTDYEKRVLYRAYDVTAKILPGKNALGAILGDGWYSGYIGFARQRDHYGEKTRASLMLHFEYQDGTTRDLATSPDWKAATGPILESDFLMGETYDARKELTGWSTPAYDDSAWSAVDTGSDEVNPVIQWHPGPPVVALRWPLRSTKLIEIKPGVFILDFGRNVAGIPSLSLQNTKPGQKITLRFAERLNPDGTLYTTNYRDARSLDTYICKGADIENWSPRFTFHGYQYAEITGLEVDKAKFGAATLTSLALSSDTPVVGHFECSDPMLNTLHQNILTTQRSNFLDIPTDCPQRDERLGWTGDAQVYIRAATLNADVHAFFTKWLQDLVDGQRADGQFPMVAPVKVAGDDGGPAWADAGVICPWTLYQVYGDRRLLERQYPSMVKFIEFCQNRSTDGLLPPDQFHAFGDWLSIKAETPKDVIYTAYYAYSTLLTSKAADVLGRHEEARRFKQLYEDIKAAFNKAYVNPDTGRIKGDTQAVYVLALAFDLVDGENAKKAADHLVADIESKGTHLSTGFIGTKDLMLVLAKIGRNDVAYQLLHNDTFPSWGFSIKQGATSIWERWDGWTPENGFQDPGMNSFAHYSFGAVYQWMVENIAGIHAGSPSYKTIIIAPQPGGKLTHARTRYDSIRGLIETDWKLADGKLDLKVTIPANTTATVVLPTPNPAQITESSHPLSESPGIADVKTQEGTTALQIGSGNYHFTLPVP